MCVCSHSQDHCSYFVFRLSLYYDLRLSPSHEQGGAAAHQQHPQLRHLLRPRSHSAHMRVLGNARATGARRREPTAWPQGTRTRRRSSRWLGPPVVASRPRMPPLAMPPLGASPGVVAARPPGAWRAARRSRPNRVACRADGWRGGCHLPPPRTSCQSVGSSGTAGRSPLQAALRATH